MTSNLHARVWKQKSKPWDGHTADHGCDRLVWFERHQWVTEAIQREKRLRKWLRTWKLNLIEADNPDGLTSRRTGIR